MTFYSGSSSSSFSSSSNRISIGAWLSCKGLAWQAWLSSSWSSKGSKATSLEDRKTGNFWLKERICIKKFGFALRLRNFVQKLSTWGHNPQPQTQPSDHGSWICILWSLPRGRSPLRRHRSMQIQDPWSDGCVCGCGCGLCPQVKNFCTKVLNLRAKPKFLMHIRPSIMQSSYHVCDLRPL